MCAAVEYFCKQVIQNIVLELAESAEKFEDISPKLAAANFAYTGLYFQKERDSYINGGARLQFEELSKGLGTCRPTATVISLNSRAFTEFLGNCTPEQLENRFEELGIGPPFNDEIAGYSKLKAHFGGGGTREVAKLARAEMEKLISKRNQLVHSTTISEIMTVEEVLNAVAFARALIGGLKRIVDRA